MNKILRSDLEYPKVWLGMAFFLLLIMVVISYNAYLMWLIDEVTDDWVVHILGFAIITVAFCGPLQRHFRTKIFIAFLLFGILIELLQTLLPGRNPSLLDLSANLVGLLLGWWFLGTRYGDWCLLLEQRLARR